MNELVPAIVGEVVVLLIVLGVVWILFREFVRVAMKVIVPVAILTALALWLGVLDRTFVADILVTAGDWVMSAIRTVGDWIAMAAIGA